MIEKRVAFIAPDRMVPNFILEAIGSTLKIFENTFGSCRFFFNLETFLVSGPKFDYVFNFNDQIFPRSIFPYYENKIINLHPGSLYHPGRGVATWPILLDEPAGWTAHFVTEKIDAGPIIYTRYQSMREIERLMSGDVTAIELHKLTMERMPDFVNDLLAYRWNENKFTYDLDLRWHRKAYTQKDVEEAMVLDLDVNGVMFDADHPEIINRHVRAFDYPGKPGPFVKIGEHLFEYKHPEGK